MDRTKNRVGIVISGGDCPGLNTVIDAIVKTLDHEYDIFGFIKGFEGLLNYEFIMLDRVFTSERRWVGGTYLKSVNKGHFPGKIGTGELAPHDKEIINKAYDNYKKLGLEGLIVVGGDGTLSMANALQSYGFNIVGVPKSIDNDLRGTDFTFGFHTAVEVANEALDRLHTTTTSHDRVMILELMGRDAGWISLYSGIAGGANVILIPEIPFSYEKIIAFLEKRKEHARNSSIIVVAEGAKEKDGEVVTRKNGSVSSQIILGGLGEQVANYLNKNTSFEARANSLGHIQRGGSPTSFDRVLSTLLGTGAAKLFQEKKYGKIAVFKNNQIEEASIDEAVKSLKLVEPQSQIIEYARTVGICFGD